jgi:hypothetical protein
LGLEHRLTPPASREKQHGRALQRPDRGGAA